MARLIDADVVEKVLNERYKALAEEYGHYDHYTTGYGDALSVIEDSPTVDAVPVVHGRWVAVPSSDMMTGKAYKCSECGKMRYGSYMPNYCQVCGAHMDLEVE